MLYSAAVLTVSLGYVSIMALCIPMSMLNLDDNVKVVQTASFAFLVVLCLEFCAYFVCVKHAYALSNNIKLKLGQKLDGRF